MVQINIPSRQRMSLTLSESARISHRATHIGKRELDRHRFGPLAELLGKCGDDVLEPADVGQLAGTRRSFFRREF